MKFILFCLIYVILAFGCSQGNEQQRNENTMKTTLLKDFAQYNLWANKQFVNWLEQASEEQLNQEIESSFSTLRATLIHLWSAEHGWMMALDEKPWSMPYDSAEFNESTSELMRKFILTSERLNQLVQHLDSDVFNEERTRGEGKPIETVQEIILHVFNHATFHRGQLVTLGRQVGLKQPPRTDYIYYIREIR